MSESMPQRLIESFPGILAIAMATRSISVSLEEGLLADLDAHSANRSAAVSEAISLWLQQRQLEALQLAYTGLAQLHGGDLKDAARDTVTMGAEAMERLDG